ncbi:MAG: hypothetical protein DWQ49_09920 [Bacteroidetes bacterium]|nr:MAG: hypothetical protein DWQ49_09920 [Bacteroidota bacterium]
MFYNNTLRIYNAITGALQLTVASPYTIAELHEIQFEMQPGGNRMYFVHNDVAQHELLYDPSIPLWTLQPISFTSPPAAWVAGNYPSAVTFAGQRAWFGGSPNNQQTLWGSVVGQFSDMSLGTATASDAMAFNITKSGKIEWLSNAKNLLVGTENSEHIIFSNDGTQAIKPGTVDHEEQSEYGSYPLKPFRIGLYTFYLSQDRTKIRYMWYNYDEQGHISDDLTFIADGEFPSPIKNLIYQKKPDSLIWAVLDDGSFASCTYFKEGITNPIIGWHFHTITDGSVKDMCVIEVGEDSYLIRAVAKTVNGTQQITLEQYNPDELLDSMETVTHVVADNNITGVTMLAGKTVNVLADGAVHPDVTLDASGNGTINYDANNIKLGFKFSAISQTLPYIQPTQGGTNASWKKRPNKVGVRLYNSSIPLINGKRPPERSYDTDMDTPEPLITADVYAANLGYDEFGQVTVEQDLPIKLRFTAILGQMTASDL